VILYQFFPKTLSLAEDHKNLLKTPRMSEIKSGKSLRFKMLGSISDLPAAMGKMTEVLDAIDKMNKAIEGLTRENKGESEDE
jgi:hypothetical protein